MKKNLVLIIGMVLFITSLYGQEELNVGKKYNLYSNELHENREYWIYLPDGYESYKEKYPVIYLLDGESNFFTLVAVQKALTKGMYNYMPESIIVGVVNTNRTRDLTPSKSFLKRDGNIFFENSGGAEKFYNFLIEELRPHVDSTYRSNNYNILVGHSFGGLFVINTWVHHPLSFNSYVSIDPSLWWDNRKIIKESKDIWKKIGYKGKNLYIAMSKKDKQGNNEHSDAINDFCQELSSENSLKNNLLRFKWKYYPEEDHGTIIMPGIYDAFKFIFQGITLPVKKIPKNPELIDKYYNKLSSELNYTFEPSENLLYNLAEYALSVGETEGALKIIEQNIKLDPENAKIREIERNIRKEFKLNN